jgi:hypothetical protein
MRTIFGKMCINSSYNNQNAVYDEYSLMNKGLDPCTYLLYVGLDILAFF